MIKWTLLLSLLLVLGCSEMEMEPDSIQPVNTVSPTVTPDLAATVDASVPNDPGRHSHSYTAIYSDAAANRDAATHGNTTAAADAAANGYSASAAYATAHDYAAPYGHFPTDDYSRTDAGGGH